MKTFYWLFIIAVFCLFLVTQRVQTLRTGMQVSRLEKEVSLKESRNQYLQHKISALSSPQKVNKEAQEKLEMRLTPVEKLVVIE
ncbi:cell division protein FtsL [Elusimicrobium posterum]|uniref:hypothetical protein n=1 Tax=Elusimicrobium posterum TaxID=3116653 RepID=UPI003C71594B